MLASPESVLAPGHRLPMKGSIMNLLLQPLPSPPERRTAGPPRARRALRKGKRVLRGSPAGLGRLLAELPAAVAAKSRLSAEEGAGGAGGAPARPPGPSCCARGPGAGGAPRSCSSAAAREVGPGAPPPPARIPPFLGSEARVCY